MASNIRILHVTESHSKEAGGVTTVVNDLAENMTKLGLYCCIVAATDRAECVPEGVDFIGLGERCKSAFSLFSNSLFDTIHQIIKKRDITVIHLHGFWMPVQLVAAKVAIEMKIPFVITSHGMLEPWLWIGKGWKGFVKKKIYFSMIAHPVYKYASTIHAITVKERDNLKNYFPTNQHAVLPNAIELEKNRRNADFAYDKVIFFIGRINPVKGVDLLLEAFLAAKLSSVWQLVIAGPEDVPGYASELRKFVEDNGLDAQVKFIGPVYAEVKDYWYRRAWVTVVPSYSEVIGMINLEASVLYCPTITTVTTGLADWEEGGGMLINPDVSDLTTALKTVAAWSDETRQNKGIASHALVKSKYSWGVVGNQWMELYSALVSEENAA